MAEITLDKLTKVYGDGTRAVSELDLEIADGEFVVLVGPSGCGKTSALRMVAGLEPITDGRVLIGGEVVNALPPKDRDIAMIFQNYALYPHMSAFDNMAFGLKLRGMKKESRGDRVNGAAKTLGLAEVLPKKPRTLSGGQRQRVAMGRAIVREPRAFLMDEPLSNLDAKLRVEDARGDRPAAARAERDHDLRHARPGRGDDARRPRRDHARRPAAAGGEAAGPLRPAAQPLRRRIHRLTGDEPRRR